ncbi:MAG: tRNA pseudouridine(38-40) synthase TruA [Sulfurospirillaceae bacterium]|nr:tRNA pseudouridine(38-40) synthase TruA [Sulfurospirillaceae bacterium]MDD3462856.1 tRNA pseudouridine(38-40) synthase TruA [Sulfurospirillaceae bacterium]
MRVQAILAYDGSEFEGFQVQKKDARVKTVAGTINDALKRLSINSKVVGSGRTDKGVHATGQIVHFDIPSYWSDIEKLRKKLNLILKPSILIYSIKLVDETFHARFSAKKRIYRYFVYEGAFSPFLAKYCAHFDKIDVKVVNESAKLFIGEHDFGFFKKSGSENKSDIRTIFRSGAYRRKDFVVIYFYGNAFLRSQIRMMCDFLFKISEGKLDKEALLEQLQKKHRHTTTFAPASGLYLSKVHY